MGFRYATGRLYKAAGGVFFDPTSISGLKLWLDFSDASTLYTDAGSTLVSSDGDAIYQANDKSGNNNHIVQATSSKRPLYKTNIKNSLSIARFDGADDYMQVAFTLNQPTHYYIVVKDNFDYSSWGRIFGGKVAKNDFISSYATGYYLMEGSKLVQNLLPLDTTNYHIFRCLFNSTASKFGNNGDSYGSDIDIGTTNAGGVTLAAYSNGGFLSACDIAEFIVYDAEVSSTNESSLLQYLNTKWSIY